MWSEGNRASGNISAQITNQIGNQREARWLLGGWHLNVCSHARMQLLVNNAAIGKLVSTELWLCRSISGAAYGENKQALEKVLERKFLQPQSCTYNLIFVF